ncbi:MAG: hypothetical protein IKF09_06630 [Clostridiales bacterium]|nr:hypothetical protein [Clostridiales bacterium]
MKYRFWTVQSREVLDIIERDGIYHPDFEKSDYLKLRSNMTELYDFFLESYNNLNDTDCKGLVFCFVRGNSKGVIPIEDYDDFKAFITSSRLALDSLWRNISTEDKIIISFEKELTFNSLRLDLNDFQYMIPPVVNLPEYPEDYLEYLEYMIQNGKAINSAYPCNVIQAHVGDIKKDEIVSVHPMFDLDGFKTWNICDYGEGRFIEADPPRIQYLGRTFYGVRYCCGVCGKYMLKSNCKAENKRIAYVPTMRGPLPFNSIFFCPGCMKFFTTANFGLPLSAGRCAEYDAGGDKLLFQNEFYRIEMYGADVIDNK